MQDSSHLDRSRRRALAGLGLLAVGAVACGRRVPESEEPVVNLYNWYDYLAPQVLRDFQATTGILPRYDAFDSNQTLEAKLLAGRSGYDVVFPSAATLQRLSRAGLFQPLDRARLPHHENLDARLLARLAAYDP